MNGTPATRFAANSAILALALTGCASVSDVVILLPSPPDMTTSVFETTPIVYVPRSAFPADAEERRRLLDGMRLVIWPEGAAVPAMAEVVEDYALATDEPPPLVTVAVTPMPARVDRWFAIEIDERAGWAVGGGAVRRGIARYSRFRVGSQSVVVSVHASRSDGAVSLEVILSEAASDTRPDTELVSTGLRDCVAGGPSEARRSVLRLTCTAPEATEIVVELAPDIDTVAGMFVTEPEGGPPPPMEIAMPVEGGSTESRPTFGVEM